MYLNTFYIFVIILLSVECNQNVNHISYKECRKQIGSNKICSGFLSMIAWFTNKTKRNIFDCAREDDGLSDKMMQEYMI